jgi:hypothetical protein
VSLLCTYLLVKCNKDLWWKITLLSFVIIMFILGTVTICSQLLPAAFNLLPPSCGGTEGLWAVQGMYHGNLSIIYTVTFCLSSLIADGLLVSCKVIHGQAPYNLAYRFSVFLCCVMGTGKSCSPLQSLGRVASIRALIALLDAAKHMCSVSYCCYGHNFVIHLRGNDTWHSAGHARGT